MGVFIYDKCLIIIHIVLNQSAIFTIKDLLACFNKILYQRQQSALTWQHHTVILKKLKWQFLSSFLTDFIVLFPSSKWSCRIINYIDIS